MGSIPGFVNNMFPYMLVFAPVYIILRAVWLLFSKKGNITRILREAVLFAFALYLAGLASQTVIPRLAFADGGLVILNAGPNKLNLQLFRVFSVTYNAVVKHGNYYPLLINFLGNIAVFMPIGFFVPLLWRGFGTGKTVLLGLAASLFIELCQLPVARETDIDDLWLNTLGALLGYAVYTLLHKSNSRFTERFKPYGTREV